VITIALDAEPKNHKTMFITKNTIRMHDVDIVGILYFPRQFRFVHEALEDFLTSEGIPFDKLLQEKNFLFVIVHCESDYLAPLTLGNKIEVHVHVDNIGTSSFTMAYTIYLESGKKVGTAKTVHVSLDHKTKSKILIPEHLHKILKKHLIN